MVVIVGIWTWWVWLLESGCDSSFVHIAVLLYPHEKGCRVVHLTLSSNMGWADIGGSNIVHYKAHRAVKIVCACNCGLCTV